MNQPTEPGFVVDGVVCVCVVVGRLATLLDLRMVGHQPLLWVDLRVHCSIPWVEFVQHDPVLLYADSLTTRRGSLYKNTYKYKLSGPQKVEKGSQPDKDTRNKVKMV